MRGSTILLIIVAIIFPPAAVAYMTGCSCDLLINVLLTILGYIPGHLHAFWLIYKRSKAENAYGRGQYRYVGSGVYEPLQGGTTAAPAGGVGSKPNYGSTGPGY
ncbi:hypothetical protein EDD17DRAFT_103461 [Pisolithus thermaeus]|nr:hypothetical protein EV401DRAFT_1887191 [Pisolithus croceorrhizus]KAI6146083.1 hypothetical protein EDD17DRAFT_103461 [Pisolithus thermaeus]